jgi:hypothetical protein
MVCLGLTGCQDGHQSAMDIFLTLLVVVTAVVAARLLVCAVTRCLGSDEPAAHHHHHQSPDSTDVDEDVEAWEWGGAGLAIFGQGAVAHIAQW